MVVVAWVEVMAIIWVDITWDTMDIWGTTAITNMVIITMTTVTNTMKNGITMEDTEITMVATCLLYTSPSPRDS